MADFKLLRRDIWSGGLKLDELKGFEEDFLLGRGESVAASYPKKPATYSVDKASVAQAGPKRADRGAKKASNALTDLLRGGDPQILVVSERMKDAISKVEKEVEFLPVTIKGHSEPYFIANFLEQVECLDLKKSGAKVDKGEVKSIKKLVIRKDALPKGRALFQLKEQRDLFLIDDKLTAAFEKAGLTGFETMDLDAYDPT